MTLMNDSVISKYDGTIERTAEGGVIRFERHLPYAIGDVWNAITAPERLAQWWLPFAADIEVDLREGGAMVFRARDEDMAITCTIVRVEPPVLLEHTHVDEGALVRWELEGVDSGCILRLSHSVPDADAAIERCYVVGLHTSLARLVPCLVGAPVPWDWDAFAVAQAHYATLGFAPPLDQGNEQ